MEQRTMEQGSSMRRRRRTAVEMKGERPRKKKNTHGRGAKAAGGPGRKGGGRRPL
jgi:hypothetical protein